MADLEGLNRTMVGLKFLANSSLLLLARGLNRTMVGLKFCFIASR